MSEDELYNLSDEELQKEVFRIRQEEQEQEVSSDSIDEPVEALDEDATQTDQQTDPNVPPTDEESTEDVSEEQQVPTTYKIKANGLEYDFTIDEMQKLASKGIDYTKKMQTIAPYRKTIDVIAENGITQDDINLFIDIKKGNKEALATLVKNMNIDVYDLPTEDIAYTPTQYGKDENMLALQDTISRLRQEPEFERTHQAFLSMDENSKLAFVNNPSNLEGLHEDVKNGVYDAVMPKAMKAAVLDGYRRPLLDYYLIEGQEYYKNLNASLKANEQAQAAKQAEISQAKKAASLPQQRMDKKTVTDYLDEENDEEYYKWLKSVRSKY
jgi:gp57|nr:MAG TPA: hypothetical protein [Caudoviricetes sp.]